jgi:hypothetical protein
MVSFFFHGKSVHTFSQIHEKYDIHDAYIIVHQYDPLLERFGIKETKENNLILHGKMVHFNMKEEEILQRIKNILNKTQCTTQRVWCSKKTGGVCKVFCFQPAY